jgi:hypothetical protein
VFGLIFELLRVLPPLVLQLTWDAAEPELAVLPSWNSVLSPQQDIEPSSISAQVCWPPAEMAAVKLESDAARAVTGSEDDDPAEPSWPEALLPQHTTLWSDFNAHVCRLPAVSDTTPERLVDASAFTWTGVKLSDVELLPSCPSVFIPQQKTAPSLRSAQVCESPATTWVNQIESLEVPRFEVDAAIA